MPGINLAYLSRKSGHWMGLFLACCTVFLLIEEVRCTFHIFILVYTLSRGKTPINFLERFSISEANNVPYVCILWPRWEHWFVFVFLSVFVFSLAKGRNRSGQRGTMVERNFEKRLVFAPQLLMRVDSL